MNVPNPIIVMSSELWIDCPLFVHFDLIVLYLSTVLVMTSYFGTKRLICPPRFTFTWTEINFLQFSVVNKENSCQYKKKLP